MFPEKGTTSSRVKPLTNDLIFSNFPDIYLQDIWLQRPRIGNIQGRIYGGRTVRLVSRSRGRRPTPLHNVAPDSEPSLSYSHIIKKKIYIKQPQTNRYTVLQTATSAVNEFLKCQVMVYKNVYQFGKTRMKFK